LKALRKDLASQGHALVWQGVDLWEEVEVVGSGTPDAQLLDHLARAS
jgi:hypothetical protein